MSSFSVQSTLGRMAEVQGLPRPSDPPQQHTTPTNPNSASDVEMIDGSDDGRYPAQRCQPQSSHEMAFSIIAPNKVKDAVRYPAQRYRLQSPHEEVEGHNLPLQKATERYLKRLQKKFLIKC